MSKACFCILALLALSTSARADVIVAVQNSSVTTNGTGFVDVLISSSVASELLTTTSFEFLINGSPKLNGSLEFLQEADPVNFSPPGYVFGPATGNYADSLLTSTNIFGGDIYGVGDTSIAITGATQTLVRLNLQHNAIGDPTLAVGDTFTISLNPLGANDFSFWDDSDPDPMNHSLVSWTIDPSSFTSFGTITIASAAVPEPGTFAVLSIAGIGLIGRRLRRRQKA